MDELPELPEPQWHDCDPLNAAHTPFYTAEDMRSYALEALKKQDAKIDEWMKAAQQRGAKVERERCAELYGTGDVAAPIGNSAWGEAYQDGWIAGTQAYRDAIRARTKSPASL